LYGGIALINKAYRNTFTDNDITLLVLTMQKLAYQLETVFLKELRLDNFENIIRKDTQRGDIKYEYRLYKDILQSIEFGLMVFDQNFIILYLNKFAQNILGIESVKNISLLDALGTEAFKTVERLIKQNKITALRQEILITKLPNLSLYLGFSIYQLFSSAESKQYALTFMEISQRKRAQAEIQRMDRMISLGVLASGIAHEIRNPLAGIKAMAQTLEEEMKNDHIKIEYVKRIIRQVNRLDVLLRSFFSYAKPLRPNLVVCNISDIVHEVLPFFDQKIKEKNIRIKEKYEHDLRPIYVDFNQIQQVIFNLIINSIDAMENGGILSIIARKPEGTRTLIDRRQSMPKVFSEEYCELSIKDTGTGIDSENINQIYNPFFTTKSNGIGLGLSVVYQIIREHRGQITVTSELGKGTTFNILLPSYTRK
jgi:signal transduction histidine kinase